MYIPLYIPKSVIVGFLFFVGCALGWMLHGSANDVVRPALLQSGPAIAGPPLMGPADGTAAPTGTTTLIDAASAAPPGIQSIGVAATPGSTVEIDTGPGGSNSGALRSTGYAATPRSTLSIGTAPGSAPSERPPTAPSYAPNPPAAWNAAPYAAPAPPRAVPVPAPAPSYAAPAPGPWYTPPFSAPSYAAPAPSYAAPAPAPSPWYPAPAPSYAAPAPWYAAPAPAAQAFPLVIPPFFGEQLLTPMPGATTRGVAFSEWESYRTDVAGRNIMVTTDDSNVFRDRNGNLNGNTGDTDASGLNVTDATDSVIRGSESADEAPYQTVAAALVDLASDAPGGGLGSDPDDDPDDEDDGDSNTPDPGANPPPPFAVTTAAPMAATTAQTMVGAATATATGETTASSDGDAEVNGDAPAPGANGLVAPVATQATQATQPTTPTSPYPTPGASAAVVTSSSCDPDGDDCGDDTSSPEEWDFPYLEWTRQISGDAASAVHTDEGTSLSSGADALVIGADGYDDDDNRAAGENIIITRDDGNVVLGGTGDVNAQIGDSEQGAVIMDVTRTFIQGGGAY